MGQRIPTLGEALEWGTGAAACSTSRSRVGQWPYEGLEAKVVALIREHEMVDQTIVISFEHPTVARVKALAPEIATGTLWSARPIDPVSVARGGRGQCDPAVLVVLRCRDGGEGSRSRLSVHPWATSEPAVVERLIALGVDSICSNHPDVVVGALLHISDG